MFRPSLTSILSAVFLAYMANSIWTMAQLFLPPNCEPGDPQNPCLTSALEKNPQRTIILFSTLKTRPSMDNDLNYLGHLNVKDPQEEVTQTISVKLPEKVKRNGTMYLSLFSVPLNSKKDPAKDWYGMVSDEEATYSFIPLTVHQVAEAATFNLLSGETAEEKAAREKTAKARDDKPVTHVRSKITVNFMADLLELPARSTPQEVAYLMRLSKNKKQYLPITYVDELSLRLRDLLVVNKTDTAADIEFTYKPISFGKLRLFLQFTAGLSQMHQLGFTMKDTDEVKGIFADTNMVLLLVTFSVSAIHLLFDFLAFKNDISFWRNKRSMEGLSTTTVLWRAFSQTVIFFYLMDEETSLLVLIPSGVAAVIEMWKVTKAFKVTVKFSGCLPKLSLGSASASEKSTEAFDSESMKYLSYLLYPLCIGGAVYSLLYTPHKSWWSWTIQSTVNGVYAFGFLFMLPQLFVNYKLKSVAHLPWRAFMYKAFNTFIDDLFAFIITMPTAHRVACFRDDIVFLVYLYQRYLYPVDKTRIDASGMIEETPDAPVEAKDDDKKTK